MKHIDTMFLWVQDLVSDQRLQVKKKHTSEMLADFLTKPTTEGVIAKCMRGLNFEFKSGWHESAYDS